MVFADGAGRAHARRWSNRQSGLSAVRDTTSSVLIVAEALHATAADDVRALMSALADDLKTLWSTTPEDRTADPTRPRAWSGEAELPGGVVRRRCGRGPWPGW